jgi:hypothetical protein
VVPNRIENDAQRAASTRQLTTAIGNDQGTAVSAQRQNPWFARRTFCFLLMICRSLEDFGFKAR